MQLAAVVATREVDFEVRPARVFQILQDAIRRLWICWVAQ